MSFLLPKQPRPVAPPPLPPPPKPAPALEAVKEGASELEKEAAKRRRGSASTIITGASGLVDEPILGRKKLLGA